ncbi:MAG: hypothetical protein C0402_09460 [Thermodesulfovibrio sp.]|nr:hypothetical protein [Thermodesulfovibrio sp.]
MLVINADDFGYSSEINQAIVACFEKGYCSSATVMSNTPGFEEACQLIHDHNLMKDVGIHFVLSEGFPLTDDIKRCRRFCNSEGKFIMSRESRYLMLSSSEKRALASELRVQISKCRENDIAITHADSHHHVHEEWGIAAVVIALCREAGIPYLRKARNCGPGRFVLKRWYRHHLNRRIQEAGLARTEYFGSAADALFLLGKSAERAHSIEIMVHPAYNTGGALIDATDGACMADISCRFRML